MTRTFIWLASSVGALSALAVLLVALAFLPPRTWETFIPLATLAATVCVLLAALAAQALANRLAAPLHQIARAIEDDSSADEALGRVPYPPEEVAPLLGALRNARARLRATVVELQRGRAQLSTILEHMADGVLVLDAEERVELSNPAALRMLRQPALVGRRFAEVARDADLVDLARAASGPAPVVRVVEVVQHPAPSHRWLQVVATRLPDGARTLVLLQDVSELRRAEAARRDFVANVSHELRTPIAALTALVETLEAGALKDPAAGPDFLRRMHVEVDGLAHLVTELLELARVESGRATIDRRPCSADDLLCEAVERMRPYAERMGLRVDVRDDRVREEDVLADRQRIGQVFANLLANAAKFTRSGGRIEVGSRRQGETVEFWVADSGIGIARDNLLRVFERFYKTDPSRTGGGTGLGLAICKHLVLAHGGSIWAESPGEGRGATFRFTLPLVPRGS